MVIVEQTTLSVTKDINISDSSHTGTDVSHTEDTNDNDSRLTIDFLLKMKCVGTLRNSLHKTKQTLLIWNFMPYKMYFENENQVLSHTSSLLAESSGAPPSYPEQSAIPGGPPFS
jgi:hypothetical protein